MKYLFKMLAVVALLAVAFAALPHIIRYGLYGYRDAMTQLPAIELPGSDPATHCPAGKTYRGIDASGAILCDESARPRQPVVRVVPAAPAAPVAPAQPAVVVLPNESAPVQPVHPVQPAPIVYATATLSPRPPPLPATPARRGGHAAPTADQPQLVVIGPHDTAATVIPVAFEATITPAP